jgi:hypothetical protein
MSPADTQKNTHTYQQTHITITKQNINIKSNVAPAVPKIILIFLIVLIQTYIVLSPLSLLLSTFLTVSYPSLLLSFQFLSIPLSLLNYFLSLFSSFRHVTHLLRMITDVVPSPTSSSCALDSSIILLAAGWDTSTSRRMQLPSFVITMPP